jgi:hypothetical protein
MSQLFTRFCVTCNGALPSTSGTNLEIKREKVMKVKVWLCPEFKGVSLACGIDSYDPAEF